MLGLIKKMFIGLLTGLVNASNHTKYMLLSNQKYMTQPAPIHLRPNEYSQELHYYPFAVKLDKCVGSCNTPNDLYSKVCIPNKTGDYIWNPASFSCENDNYLTSIIDNSVITCDEIIEADAETELFDEKKKRNFSNNFLTKKGNL